MSTQELENFAKKVNDTADAADKSQDEIRKLSEATGINGTAAAILSKNYETLASKTTTASEKFSSLKQNMDILSGGTQAAANASKAYHASIDDTNKSLAAIKDQTKGAVGGLYDLKTGFDFSSEAGRNLHTTISTASDGIVKLGSDALDKALKDGKSLGDAQAIAIEAMQPGVASLKKSLEDVGMSQPQIDSIIKSFGLLPADTMKAITLEVKGDAEAQKKIIMTKLAADSFANGNFAGVLSALPEAAKKAIADVTGKGKEFSEGNYEAVMKSFDGTAGGRDAALAAILSTVNGDYSAALKAWDATGSGRAAAEAALYGTGKCWQYGMDQSSR